MPVLASVWLVLLAAERSLGSFQTSDFLGLGAPNFFSGAVIFFQPARQALAPLGPLLCLESDLDQPSQGF
jgi:hypothetical protein